MKNGDVIVNVKGRLVATFKGWIAGEISTYEITIDNQTEEFTGKTYELLSYCSKKIEEHNKSCMTAGGTVL